MKSPNASLTSCIRASFASVRKCRTLRPAVAMMLICPLVFAACQSTGSGQTRAPKSDNPYAKNDPRTPEEEEYYRDVYSGDWSEDSQSGLASVYKHSGSVTMPKHWQSMPPGAKTLEEIRCLCNPGISASGMKRLREFFKKRRDGEDYGV